MTMSNNSDETAVFYGPWEIDFLQDDNRTLNDPVNSLTVQAGGLTIEEKPALSQSKNPCQWSEHERLTGEILNTAAQRAAAETFKNICVYHPTQSHKPSENTSGTGIRSDYIIAWSYNGVRKNTMVVDAKDYHTSIPRREYEKICHDMCETKVRFSSRPVLFLLSPSYDFFHFRRHVVF